MSDCANIEIRELLPERLHDALDAEARALVDAHLATCDDCAAEFALLRAARDAMRATVVPRIDTASIVAALPRPTRVVSAPTVVRRNRMVWRIAAAISIISLGGISFATMKGVGGGEGATATLTSDPQATASAPSESVAAVAPASSAQPAVAQTPSTDTRARGLSLGGGLSDLGDAQLQSLLGDLDKLEAAPVAEPESMTGSKLVSSSGTGSEE